jgi:hypothetical protein
LLSVIDNVVVVAIAVLGWKVLWSSTNATLRQQYLNDRKVEESRFRKELQARTADDAIALLQQIFHALSDLGCWVGRLASDLEAEYETGFRLASSWAGPPDDPPSKLRSLGDVLSKAYSEFLAFFVSREIILFAFQEDNSALSKSMSDLSAVKMELYKVLSAGYVLKYCRGVRLTESEIAAMRSLAEAVREKAQSINWWVFDFVARLQNAFLADLMGHRLPQSGERGAATQDSQFSPPA